LHNHVERAAAGIGTRLTEARDRREHESGPARVQEVRTNKSEL
jgi:hypothetical protein